MKQDVFKNRTTFAATLLLGVFALSVVLTILVGAGAYRKLLSRSRQAYESRTVSQYLAGKLHQAPEAVYGERFGSADALVIPQTVGGEAYETRIYCFNGYLMELYCLSGSGLAPEDGEKILPVRDLQLRFEENLLEIQWTDAQGKSAYLMADLPMQEEVLP